MNRYCGAWWGTVACASFTGAVVVAGLVWVERRARGLWEGVHG